MSAARKEKTMELTTDIFSLFDKKWALLTAGARKSFNSMKSDDAVDQVINMFARTRNNRDFIRIIEKNFF